MKRMIGLIGLMVIFLIVTACGNDSTENPKPKQDDEEVLVNQNEEKEIDYPQLSSEIEDDVVVTMNTTLGPIKMKLFPSEAPKAVENFLTHAEEGYYDGVIFHRVMEDFMIQGGDPTGTGMGGESIYGEPFEDEFSERVFHLRGALSMANAGPDTNGSQFFIVQNQAADSSALNEKKELVYSDTIKEAYEEQGGTPHLDYLHTVFGQVIEGMDTVDKIAAVEAEQTMPIEEVVIESIEIMN